MFINSNHAVNSFLTVSNEVERSLKLLLLLMLLLYLLSNIMQNRDEIGRYVSEKSEMNRNRQE